MMDFVATKDFKTPYVVSTGMPHKPTAIKLKQFRRGEIISGEMKTSRGKPAFVLYKGVMVVPLSCVRQVITKDINPEIASKAEGEEKEIVRKVVSQKPTTSVEKKKKYMDAVIVGAIAGFAATMYAEKKAWLPTVEMKNRLIGAGIGALAGMYLVFRFSK